MTRSTSHIRRIAALAAVLVGACAAPAADDEVGLGPVEQVVEGSMRDSWPGVDRADGRRIVARFNGFAGGEPVAYWFGGPAPRATADMYWFCREGDDGCPLDARGAVDRTRTLGRPVFARMPGEASYSPFWWVRVVRVPDDYEPDSIKSVLGIQRAVDEGWASLRWHHHDFGGWIGPEKAIEHTWLVLAGTELEGNGAPLPDGRPSRVVPLSEGWYQRYLVHFYDFTDTEGVLPPAAITDEWVAPVVPAADLFVVFRDCAGGSTSPVCAAGGVMTGAVSERALDLDLTGDGDRVDTNTLFSGSPRDEPVYPDVAPYSPLWAAQQLTVVAAHDGEVALIDTTGDQATTDLRDAAAIAELVDAGRAHAPAPLPESRIGVHIPGNDGAAHYDCPAQVAARGSASGL